MSKGYVYILSNKSMPGLVKIGKTTRDVLSRASELFQTGVPTPFKVEHYVATPDCHDLEARAHEKLEPIRISAGREFFCMDANTARAVLNHLHEEQVNEWLDEFLPGHIASAGFYSMDGDRVEEIAEQLGAHWCDVMSAMREITAEEIQPAMGRYRDRMNRLSEKVVLF